MTFEDFCAQNNIYVTYFPFTTKVRGLCIKVDDHFIVAINPKFTSDSQKRTLQHEIIHIMENHFQNEQHTIDQCEDEVYQQIRNMKKEFENYFI